MYTRARVCACVCVPAVVVDFPQEHMDPQHDPVEGMIGIEVSQLASGPLLIDVNYTREGVGVLHETRSYCTTRVGTTCLGDHTYQGPHLLGAHVKWITAHTS
jgi:hypothetical protein